MKIACAKEIAYRMGFIGRSHLLELARSLNKSGCGDYLMHIIDSHSFARFPHQGLKPAFPR